MTGFLKQIENRWRRVGKAPQAVASRPTFTRQRMVPLVFSTRLFIYKNREEKSYTIRRS